MASAMQSAMPMEEVSAASRMAASPAAASSPPMGMGASSRSIPRKKAASPAWSMPERQHHGGRQQGAQGVYQADGGRLARHRPAGGR